MRLKCYSAPSMAEAMADVRRELGEDAIIVSTQRAVGGQGVRITAALEETASDDEVHIALSGGVPSPVLDHIREQLIYHGLPPRLIERLVNAARRVGTEDPTMACAGALDELFAFAPLPERQAPRPFMMVGPPGSGKTIAVAKLAARGRLNGRSVGVISADTVRAGALEQLSAFTNILNVDLRKARGAHALAQLLYEDINRHDLVFIDTPGLNPFLPGDIEYLANLIAEVDVEPVLVMAAGGDPVEAAEMAEAFAQVGATRLLATRLDMTRRLGAILAAADAAQFMFSEVSINPHIANGLCQINPVSMARLLIPPDERFTPPPGRETIIEEWPSDGDSGYGTETFPSGHEPEVDFDHLDDTAYGHGEQEEVLSTMKSFTQHAEQRPAFTYYDEFDDDGEAVDRHDQRNEVRR